ncbi:MAG TPA: hypothetical protein VF017_02875 [Thermoanaerobaculia bacterium]|nr:hypothetical protein [Thermoanaerobaculia bacterium]
MTSIPDIDKALGTALDEIAKSERGYKAAIFVAAILEAAFLLAVLKFADFSDRTHLLLVISSIATYSILAFGLIAVGAHVSRNTLRVLKALELLRP